jgi:hypothetical protein
VQHDPHEALLVQAELDEVVAAAEGAQLLAHLLARDDLVEPERLVPGPEIRRLLLDRARNPRMAACGAVADRNGVLDLAPKARERIGQLVRLQARLTGHHSAADVDTHGRRNDRADGRDDGADGRAEPEMDVRHHRDVWRHERQRRHVAQLLHG